MLYDVRTTKDCGLTFRIAAFDAHICALCILPFNNYLIIFFGWHYYNFGQQ